MRISEVIHNDNVNKYLKNNVNDNVRKSKDVDNIADKLVSQLNNPGARAYYCKVVWKLSEAQIWNNLEAAMRGGRDPRAYFTWLCEHQLTRTKLSEL